jgi:transient receptor potential cation channel subfamily C protein 4
MLVVEIILNIKKNIFILDRFYWVSFDPVNVAEGLYAIANIFSFSRICFLLPAFQHLGPLQISLGRMMSVSIGKSI